MRAYHPSVSIRRLLTILVAVAVLFAPSLTGAAAAAIPDHYMQMIESGHCQAPPSESRNEKETPAKSCCVSVSMGVAVTPAPPLTDGELQAAPAVFGIPTPHLSYLGEIATPPPRRS